MSLELCRLARRRPVLRESLALASICFLDMATTLYWVRAGMATESNPLMAAPLAHSEALFVAVKLASFLVPIAVLETLRPIRPEGVVKALRVCIAAYVLLYVAGLTALALTK